MKTIIRKMMNRFLAKNDKFNKKNIKVILNTFHILTLFALLAATNSLIASGIDRTILKTRCAKIQVLPLGEEITIVKISTPSQSMILKADWEIHLNMNAMINTMDSFQIGYKEKFDANLEISDISLANRFDAENINMNLQINLLNADNLIIEDYYLNDYYKKNYSEITPADLHINDTFNSNNN